MKYVIIIPLLLTILSGCAIFRHSQAYENDIFTIGEKCENLDSYMAGNLQSGTVQCGDVQLLYSYGPHQKERPLSLKEKFMKQFVSVYHQKFFEKIGIDPKVYSIMMDSVVIKDIRKKEKPEKLLWKCPPCNKIVDVRMMGGDFSFPVTINERKVDGKNYHFEEWYDDGYYYTIYYSDHTQPVLVVYPGIQRLNKKNTLRIKALSKPGKGKNKAIKLLKKVKIKKR